MRHFPLPYLAAFLFLSATCLAADDLVAVVDDVVTAKVVSVKVTKGKLSPGQECIVVRDGKTVGKLRVKTATGVCRVLEGKVLKGDIVKPAKKIEDKPDKPDKDPEEDPAIVQPPVKGPLRSLLEDEGKLLVAHHAVGLLTPKERALYEDDLAKAEDTLRRLKAAQRAYVGSTLAGRVALSLRDQGEPNLAARVDATKTKVQALPPILPDSAKGFRPLPYGQFNLLDTHPALWALPQYWGRDPIDPVFSEIRFGKGQVSFGPDAEALVRRDVKLDDLEVRGEFKIESGQSLYLILRSEVIVKFHHQHKTTGVSLKAGYNNLSAISSEGNIRPLDSGKWYRFVARLVRRRLEVKLDGKTVLDTTVSVDPKFGGTMPAKGYVGIGPHRGTGSFRKLRVISLSYAGRRSLPRFAPNLTYKKIGKERDLLSDKNDFISLFGSRAQAHLTGNHPVANKTLRIKGAPYSQFAVKGTAGDHFKVKGKLRVMEPGTIWLRANTTLMFGLQAKRRDRDRKPEREQAYFVKHSTGNFHSYDEAFAGTPLAPNQWYDWELEFHDPVGWLRLNGETIMVSRCPTERGRNPGPNQFGVSAYNAKAEVRDMSYQAMVPSPPPKLSGTALKGLFSTGATGLSRGVNVLSKEKSEGAVTAVAILQGKREPLTASSDDYVKLAEELRTKHDWPLALAVLQANYERFPEKDPRRAKAETYWRTTQQKFEIAQEAVELGELGLDNLMKVGNRTAPICPSVDSPDIWIYVPGTERLELFSPTERDVMRKFEVPIKPRRILDRGKWLLAVDQTGTKVVKLDRKTGKLLGQVEFPKGKILDWVPHPKAAKTFLSLDFNEPNVRAVMQYKVQALNEAEMSIDETSAIGMRLSIDPHGRYLYSSFTFLIRMGMGQFSPEPLNIQVQRGGYVDHMLCFRIEDEELTPLSTRPSPGVDGRALAADPSGRIVCYVARNGFRRDQNKKLLGSKVAAFRAGNVRTTAGSFDCGGSPRLIAYNPLLPEAAIYNGSKIHVFDTRTFRNLQTIDLPTAIKPNLGETMSFTKDGSFIVLGYTDKTSGVYIHPLRRPADPENQWLAEQLKKPADKLLEEARSQAKSGKLKQARKILELLVQTRAFSTPGEQAAKELLTLEKSLLLAAGRKYELPAFTLEDLPNPVTAGDIKTPPAGKNVHRPGAAKYSNREGYTQRVSDLQSYQSLAPDFPFSWLWQCHQLDKEFPDSPDLMILAIRQLIAMKRLAAAEAMAGRLMKLSDGKGWYALKGYALLAELASLTKDAKRELAARQAALRINPRNPFMHTHFGTSLRTAGLKNRAVYHDLLSLHLFPSQPALRARLEKAKLIEPLPKPKEKSIEELYKTIAPSVVLIKQRVGAGTGYFITRDGLLLTNHHVIAGGEDVLKVHLVRPGADKPLALPAQVVASDAHLDIAILAVDLGLIKVEPLMIGDANPARTGMKVIAIGNPGMGGQVLSRTVTEGIISNVRQKVAGQEYIQTSAAVNPGNSGGPLLNRNGKVIGMVTLKAHLDNVGFAIPTDRLLKYLEKQLH